MRRFTLILAVLFPFAACAFDVQTNAFNVTAGAASGNNFNQFRLTSPGYNDQEFRFTVSGVTLGTNSVGFKVARQTATGQVAYLSIQPSGVTVTGSVAVFLVAKTNVPPNGNYQAELAMWSGTTNTMRTIARGTWVVTDSLYGDQDSTYPFPTNWLDMTDYLLKTEAATTYLPRIPGGYVASNQMGAGSAWNGTNWTFSASSGLTNVNGDGTWITASMTGQQAYVQFASAGLSAYLPTSTAASTYATITAMNASNAAQDTAIAERMTGAAASNAFARIDGQVFSGPVTARVYAAGNTNTGDSAWIGGGLANKAQGDYSSIGGGIRNGATAGFTTIGGGADNNANDLYATIGGGQLNTAAALLSTIGGGRQNTASGLYDVISGGRENTSTGQYVTIGGGFLNTASGFYSAIGGGLQNNAGGRYAAVGGGQQNSGLGQHSTIGGGYQNTATGIYATIGGGELNSATGSHATIAGGYGNEANQGSFAAGQSAKARHINSFVWNDSSDFDYVSATNNSFNVRSRGGVFFRAIGLYVQDTNGNTIAAFTPTNSTLSGSLNLTGYVQTNGNAAGLTNFNPSLVATPAQVQGASNLAFAVGAGATNIALAVGAGATNLHIAQGIAVTNAQQTASNAAAGVLAVGVVATNAQTTANAAVPWLSVTSTVNSIVAATAITNLDARVWTNTPRIQIGSNALVSVGAGTYPGALALPYLGAANGYAGGIQFSYVSNSAITSAYFSVDASGNPRWWRNGNNGGVSGFQILHSGLGTYITTASGNTNYWRITTAPASNTAYGEWGQMAYDSTNIYIYHAASSRWLRVAGSLTW